MKEYLRFYINGAWLDPFLPKLADVINPATEEAIAVISMGSSADVNVAVQSAKTAFYTYSKSSKDERIALFERIIVCYKDRFDELAHIISDEMGAPMSLAKAAQAATGLGHFSTYLELLKTYDFEEMLDKKWEALTNEFGKKWEIQYKKQVTAIQKTDHTNKVKSIQLINLKREYINFTTSLTLKHVDIFQKHPDFCLNTSSPMTANKIREIRNTIRKKLQITVS